MASELVCPKCDRRMEAGTIIDRNYGRVDICSWIEGLPRMGWWLGVKLRGVKLYPVAAYRCRSCGYLESYAREPGT
jgi:hypothetical protein